MPFEQLMAMLPSARLFYRVVVARMVQLMWVLPWSWRGRCWGEVGPANVGPVLLSAPNEGKEWKGGGGG